MRTATVKKKLTKLIGKNKQKYKKKNFTSKCSKLPLRPGLNLPLRQYETENSKRKKENRNAESVSSSNAPGSREDAWKQLGSFIDFQATRAANETDKSRMKSLLFKLKQTPPKITA